MFQADAKKINFINCTILLWGTDSWRLYLE